MKLVCSPNAKELPDLSPDVMPVLLFGRADPDRMASVGAAIVEDARSAKLVPSQRAWDFLSLALAVATADLAVPRKASTNGWTRNLELEIAVNEPDLWNENTELIQNLMRFLTTDLWFIRFTGLGYSYEPPNKPSTFTEECVSLLSGGADSLVGMLDLVSTGVRPFAVSQTVHGDGEKQSLFSNSIGGGLTHFKTNHNARYSGDGDGDQRARSMVFFAYGVLVASALQRSLDGEEVLLYACENGLISINPPLTDARLGSLSTRTTHPVYLAYPNAV